MKREQFGGLGKNGEQLNGLGKTGDTLGDSVDMEIL